MAILTLSHHWREAIEDDDQHNIITTTGWVSFIPKSFVM
jgi:hypothetical protein